MFGNNFYFCKMDESIPKYSNGKQCYGPFKLNPKVEEGLDGMQRDGFLSRYLPMPLVITES